MCADIYSAIEKKGFRDGIGFIITKDNCSIVVHIYCGVIIRAKAPRLSFDQICETLSHGDMQEISFQESAESPDTAQAPLLAHTFPAVAASIINPAGTSHTTLIKIVRLMSGLVKSDKDQGTKAFDMMRREIAKLHPGFLIDVATIKKMMSELGEKFGLESNALEYKDVPDILQEVPGWVFRHFDSIKDIRIKDIVLYFLFFGQMSDRMIRTKIDQATSLGAKRGHAIMSKTVYPVLKDSGSASLFSGADKICDMKIDWNIEKKSTIAITKIDLDHLGLKNGDAINLFFN
jgi:hypothetical protein